MAKRDIQKTFCDIGGCEKEADADCIQCKRDTCFSHTKTLYVSNAQDRLLGLMSMSLTEGKDRERYSCAEIHYCTECAPDGALEKMYKKLNQVLQSQTDIPKAFTDALEETDGGT